MLDAGILLVRVLLGVLVGRVRRDSVRDILGDQLVDTVGVGPGNVAELVVEDLEDIGRFIVLGVALGVLIWMGYKRFKK